MTNPTDDTIDQDSEPTMTAPPGERPDAGASLTDPDGRGDSPDAVDADEAQRGEPKA